MLDAKTHKLKSLRKESDEARINLPSLSGVRSVSLVRFRKVRVRVEVEAIVAD